LTRHCAKLAHENEHGKPEQPNKEHSCIVRCRIFISAFLFGVFRFFGALVLAANRHQNGIEYHYNDVGYEGNGVGPFLPYALRQLANENELKSTTPTEAAARWTVTEAIAEAIAPTPFEIWRQNLAGLA